MNSQAIALALVLKSAKGKCNRPRDRVISRTHRNNGAKCEAQLEFKAQSNQWTSILCNNWNQSSTMARLEQQHARNVMMTFNQRHQICFYVNAHFLLLKLAFSNADNFLNIGDELFFLFWDQQVILRKSKCKIKLGSSIGWTNWTWKCHPNGWEFANSSCRHRFSTALKKKG